MTKPLTKSILDKFIQMAADQLTGDWVLVGGTVMGALEPDLRATMDIDIVPKQEVSNSQRLKLMSLAEQVGLPVEAINLAAEYFVKKHNQWEKELVLLKKGKSAKIFRPSASFFILLKLERLSEADFEDCLSMLKFARRKKEIIRENVWSKLAIELKKAKGDRKMRLNRLLDEQKRNTLDS